MLPKNNGFGQRGIKRLSNFRLMMASMFIAAFEVLRESIIGRIRDFFTNGFGEKGYKIDPEYESEVLAKNNSKLYASLLWLVENNVISDTDLIEFEAIKNFRNRVAHEISQLIIKEDDAELHIRFIGIAAMLNKIEKWWIVNVEIPTNDDFINKEITEDMIIPGPAMSLRIMMDVAFGSEEESKKYYKYYLEHIRGT